MFNNLAGRVDFLVGGGLAGSPSSSADAAAAESASVLAGSASVWSADSVSLLNTYIKR